MEQNTPKEHRKAELWILFILIAAQLAVAVYGMAFVKNTLFIDEIVTYGLANSVEKPFMNGTDFTNSVETDYWTTGQAMRNYLTVEPGTQFDYSTVWRNQAYDFTPPMYFVLLHTLCSLFPGVFSFWFGYVINLFAIVVTDIALYCMMRRLTHSGTVALLTVFWYVFTLGAQCGAVFLRSYALCVMMTVLFAASLYRFCDEEKIRLSDAVLLALAAFFGTLTHDSFLIFAFFFTLFLCVTLLIRKKIRKMFIAGGTILAGTAAALLAFPATLMSFFAATDASTSKLFLFSADMEKIRWFVYLLIRLLIYDTTGIAINQFRRGNYSYVIAAVVLLSAVLIPLAFLFRKEAWMRKLRGKIAALLKQYFRNTRFIFISWLLTAVCFLFVLGVSLPNVFVWSLLRLDYVCDRYIYLLIPFFCGLVTWCIYGMISYIQRIRNSALLKKLSVAVPAVCIVGSLLLQNICGYNHFLIRVENQNGKINDRITGADCIVLTNNPTVQNYIPGLTMDADDLFLSLYWGNHYLVQEKEYEKLKGSEEPVYLLFDLAGMANPSEDSESDQTFVFDDLEFSQQSEQDSGNSSEVQKKTEILDYFEEFFGFTPEYCLTEKAGFCSFELYLLKPAGTES
ncbi:MAG: hypothetical protein IJL32_15140 [Oscillospiraceae bacterium]|nr:hypothetical protein [Oscillospiraceae bacterium]